MNLALRTAKVIFFLFIPSNGMDFAIFIYK